jgi:DNA-binding phage protein
MKDIRILEYLAAKPSVNRIGGGMALTRDFKDTVAARARRDPRFREALFTEAINAYLGGDLSTGKAILRDLVNATVGFEALAAELDKPSKSLHRMLAPHGNPSTENFFGIVNALQKKTHVKLDVMAKAGLSRNHGQQSQRGQSSGGTRKP